MLNIVLGSILVAIFWGLSSVFQRMLLKELSTDAVFIFTSLTYACFLLLYLIYKRDKIIKEIPNFSHKLIFIFIVNAILCYFIPNMLFYKLAKQNNSGIVNLLTSIYPLWSIFFLYLFFGDKIPREAYTGIVFIIIGLILLSVKF